MDRRRFLRVGLATAGGAVALPAVASVAAAQGSGASPYGSLDGIEPDVNGVILPPGFTSRIVAVAGEPVSGSEYEWHISPDGAATFPDGAGGWYHTVNSEVFQPGKGGVGAIHFGPDGSVIDAYPILIGSNSNCAGGPTPWGTWLSCEEDHSSEQGVVWECDPSGDREAVAHPAMGLFTHEAVAVDPEDERLYMTQDHPDGRLYRFTPTDYPDLSTGLLEAAVVHDDGTIDWSKIPDPSGSQTPTRSQVPETTVFSGGEGIWYHDGSIYFTTKHDNTVHTVDLREGSYSEVYRADPDAVASETAVLSGVDNITVDAGTGDLFVAEDGGNMEIVVITPAGEVAPFCRVVGHEGSEITGPCFSPRRDRLYFSSQRGPTPRTVGEIRPDVGGDGGGGITFEVTGPFNGIVESAPVVAPESTVASTMSSSVASTEPPVASIAPSSVASTEPTVPPTTQSPLITFANVGSTESDGTSTAIVIGAGLAAVAVAGGAIVAMRRRGSDRHPKIDRSEGLDADRDR